MICANDRVYYGPMVVFVCLHTTLPHYHHYADVSEGIERLKCWSSTTCQVCVCVFKIKSILAIIFHAIHGLHAFSLPISLMMIVRICVPYLIITIKSEVWSICNCLWCGHETMVCAVCLSIFLKSLPLWLLSLSSLHSLSLIIISVAIIIILITIGIITVYIKASTQLYTDCLWLRYHIPMTPSKISRSMGYN